MWNLHPTLTRITIYCSFSFIFIHSVLAIPDRIHQVCLSTLELFPLPGMLSPQVLMQLTPPLLSLCPSIILKKVHLILKCHIFPRNSVLPLTLLHFSKHFPLTILYYSLLPITQFCPQGQNCFVQHSPLVHLCLAQNRHAYVQRTALLQLLNTCLSY